MTTCATWFIQTENNTAAKIYNCWNDGAEIVLFSRENIFEIKNDSNKSLLKSKDIFKA